MQLFQCFAHAKIQTRAQQEILRRVAGQAKLRKDNDIGLMLIPGPLGCLQNQIGITRNISHQEIQLRHNNAEFSGGVLALGCLTGFRHGLAPVTCCR